MLSKTSSWQSASCDGLGALFIYYLVNGWCVLSKLLLMIFVFDCVVPGVKSFHSLVTWNRHWLPLICHLVNPCKDWPCDKSTEEDVGWLSMWHIHFDYRMLLILYCFHCRCIRHEYFNFNTHIICERPPQSWWSVVPFESVDVMIDIFTCSWL